MSLKQFDCKTNLTCGCRPNIEVFKFFKIRFYVIPNPIGCSVQCHSVDEENEEDNHWKNC